jgi:hypothetical protein
LNLKENIEFGSSRFLEIQRTGQPTYFLTICVTRGTVAGFWISSPPAPYRPLGGTATREAPVSLDGGGAELGRRRGHARGSTRKGGQGRIAAQAWPRRAATTHLGFAGAAASSQRARRGPHKVSNAEHATAVPASVQQRTATGSPGRPCPSRPSTQSRAGWGRIKEAEEERELERMMCGSCTSGI